MEKKQESLEGENLELKMKVSSVLEDNKNLNNHILKIKAENNKLLKLKHSILTSITTEQVANQSPVFTVN